MTMTAKTALKGAPKRPLVGKYEKSICVKFKCLLNAIKRVFLGWRKRMKPRNRGKGKYAGANDI